jgi:hypothetical protein
MQRFCSSWYVRNLHVMILRVNKLAESIVSIHTRLLRPSTNFSPVLQFLLLFSRVIDNAREDPIPLPRIFMPKEDHLRQLATSTYQISSYWTPSKLHAARIWLFPARPEVFNMRSIVNSMLTKFQSKTWTHFATLNLLITSQTRSLNHRHFCHGWIYSLVWAPSWTSTLLSHRNAMLRAAL